MKLILAGATGFLGTEVLHQALADARITSVVALGRRPTSIPALLPSGANADKLDSVVVPDFAGELSNDVLRHFADADACVWTIGLTPSASSDLVLIERVCLEYPLRSVHNMTKARQGQPFRFVYVSGRLAQRDQSKRPFYKPDWALIRGRTESGLLSLRGMVPGLDVAVARPGMITEKWSFTHLMPSASFTPAVNIRTLAAALLQQTRDGFEKDTLENSDLGRLGQAAL